MPASKIEFPAEHLDAMPSSLDGWKLCPVYELVKVYSHDDRGGPWTEVVVEAVTDDLKLSDQWLRGVGTRVDTHRGMCRRDPETGRVDIIVFHYHAVAARHVSTTVKAW